MRRRTATSGLVSLLRRRSRREGGMVMICGSLEVQGLAGAVEALDFAAVEGVEQRGVVGGVDVDEFEFEGFLVAVGF